MAIDPKDYLAKFGEFRTSLVDVYPDWAGAMDAKLPELARCFAASVAPQARYDLLCEALDFVGVRRESKFNRVLKEPLETDREQLYQLNWGLIQATWAELGRASFIFEDFDLYPDGSLVRLVPAKAAYFDLDGTPHYVPNICWLEDHTEHDPLPTDEETMATVWEVVSQWGPDVTNMPLYFCCEGPEDRTAQIRHEALELVEAPQA